ncbi:unnamed protein product [Rotaria sp. Silwood2]|nr:unnamed protein product [Rotaria sp. Silwood2]CAF2580523.1 unnamed protein product [Rotaria sp. Silwood2]CAF2839912.1 unnamed protein product [Rotaria sp. Silwood2]CAF2988459.1 unnamed protein product [Rotaria sp. Silwood2]CAF4299120.1 unnamed protein product [Rotaria sp. Silwood2]
MATRAAAKPGRPPAKSTVKTPGKDQIKGDKQPTNILEIVPGKFNETDWLSLLENDDTEDFIADVFDSIWTETSKQIQQIYIRRQLLPFTLMMTENALSNVIQWAFLERDEPKPTDGDFWKEDDEPIPCSMDNWGEGVVPACREERPQSIEQSPILDTERSPLAPISIQTPEDVNQIRQSSSRNSSVNSSIHSATQTKGPPKIDHIHHQNKSEQSIQDNIDDHTLIRKESPIEQNIHRLSFEKKLYNHDILVIQNQPPQLEPLSDLFYSVQIQTSSSSANVTPATTTITKHRRAMAPKISSQIGSDALASSTNITGTTTTKSVRKAESKLFDDQHIEEVISKAPVAAHSMLKSILNRPPGYRELELDDYGNVISIAKIDPDKLAPKNIRVKCDIVKPRKVVIETRPLPKQPKQMKLSKSEPKFTSVKLVLPEHSSDVGDLIQPMPGVLYEDAKLKKGDPRRYKTGMSKYTNFYDESRPLRPIARRGDLAILQAANDLLRKSKDYNDNDDNEQDPQIPKLHRLARIPPIMSGSSTSSA